MKKDFIPPRILAEYDIIITSFNTLRQDFNYVKADDGEFDISENLKVLRHPTVLLITRTFIRYEMKLDFPYDR